MIIQKWDETDKNGTFSEEIINISEYIEKVDQQNNDISTYAMTVGSQNTSKGGYSYKYYSYDKRSYNWEVKTPKTSYYNFPEAHRKQSDINGFKSAVDSIVRSERLGGAAVGVSLMTAGVNLLYASGVGAALALVGGVGAAATAIISIDSHSKDANYYNTRLRNNS
ncbi:hypothetical protein TICRE_18220 [Tissierella creatinophila DSM 6911]|uniref:Uncharacterized protein n=1 Tax=Tissierella creatinophila DSM 6911 TaxID=1123403 RepID=A0A1U7M4U9_TISCR|nr:hypothetical protein TICRE_18220 [Tissierella creatinophila DSM 6911]